MIIRKFLYTYIHIHTTYKTNKKKQEEKQTTNINVFNVETNEQANKNMIKQCILK